jgi:16S rRNA (uracil1498-N3)-methyltransferase
VAVRLGPTVLRTSTAAAVALGALGVLTRRWGLSDRDSLG